MSPTLAAALLPVLVALAPVPARAGTGGRRVDLGGAHLTLPAGWRPLADPVPGPTGVASLPGTAAGGAPGRILLSAVGPAGQGSLFVARVPGRLEVTDDTKDTLAVHAPDTLRRLWGVDYRVLWAEVVKVAGRPTLRLEGAVTRGGRRWSVLVALVPAGDHHFVLTWLLPAGAPKARYRAVDAALASFDPGRESGGRVGDRPISPGLERALAGGLVGLLVALWVRRRRHRSARTSG